MFARTRGSGVYASAENEAEFVAFDQSNRIAAIVLSGFATAATYGDYLADPLTFDGPLVVFFIATALYMALQMAQIALWDHVHAHGGCVGVKFSQAVLRNAAIHECLSFIFCLLLVVNALSFTYNRAQCSYLPRGMERFMACEGSVLVEAMILAPAYYAFTFLPKRTFVDMAMWLVIYVVYFGARLIFPRENEDYLTLIEFALVSAVLITFVIWTGRYFEDQRRAMFEATWRLKLRYFETKALQEVALAAVERVCQPGLLERVIAGENLRLLPNAVVHVISVHGFERWAAHEPACVIATTLQRLFVGIDAALSSARVCLGVEELSTFGDEHAFLLYPLARSESVWCGLLQVVTELLFSAAQAIASDAEAAAALSVVGAIDRGSMARALLGAKLFPVAIGQAIDRCRASVRGAQHLPLLPHGVIPLYVSSGAMSGMGVEEGTVVACEMAATVPGASAPSSLSVHVRGMRTTQKESSGEDTGESMNAKELLNAELSGQHAGPLLEAIAAPSTPGDEAPRRAIRKVEITRRLFLFSSFDDPATEAMYVAERGGAVTRNRVLYMYFCSSVANVLLIACLVFTGVNDPFSGRDDILLAFGDLAVLLAGFVTAWCSPTILPDAVLILFDFLDYVTRFAVIEYIPYGNIVGNSETLWCAAYCLLSLLREQRFSPLILCVADSMTVLPFMIRAFYINRRGVHSAFLLFAWAFLMFSARFMMDYRRRDEFAVRLQATMVNEELKETYNRMQRVLQAVAPSKAASQLLENVRRAVEAPSGAAATNPLEGKTADASGATEVVNPRTGSSYATSTRDNFLLALRLLVPPAVPIASAQSKGALLRQVLRPVSVVAQVLERHPRVAWVGWSRGVLLFVEDDAAAKSKDACRAAALVEFLLELRGRLDRCGACPASAVLQRGPVLAAVLGRSYLRFHLVGPCITKAIATLHELPGGTTLVMDSFAWVLNTYPRVFMEESRRGGSGCSSTAAAARRAELTGAGAAPSMLESDYIGQGTSLPMLDAAVTPMQCFKVRDVGIVSGGFLHSGAHGAEGSVGVSKKMLM
jgi:hypothetical protein